MKDDGPAAEHVNDATQFLLDQAVELENQIEAARQLARELEKINEELNVALIEAEGARVRAEESEVFLRGSEARERFLAEVSRVLASSLEYEVTVQQVAELAVPGLSDWCGVDVLGEDGVIRPLAVAHVDPEKIEWAREFRERYPPRLDLPGGLSNVMRTGRSEFYPEVSAEALENAAIDDEHREAIRKLDIRGVIIAPLSVSGRTIGALSLVSCDPLRRYTMADVGLAEELGRRAALAIDNARLYSAERGARRAAEESASRAGLLQKVMVALSLATTPEDVADAAISYGTSALGATRGAMFRLSADGASLVLLKAVGLAPSTVDKYKSFPLDAPLPLADAVRSGTTIYLESREIALARYPQFADGTENEWMPAWALIPLSVGGKALGGIAFGFAEDRAFERPEREFTESLAQQLAQALERARLYELERAARESAQAANSAKSDFLATMSHELRTPINAIQGYAQLIDLGIPGPVTDQQRDYLGRLASSAEHLLGLVNEVLDLAKIDSGTIQVNVERTVAAGTVDAALSLVRPQAKAKGIALSEQCEGSPETPYIGDEHRVRQIIANLLSNAVKFTMPGGRINVGCWLTDEPPAQLKLKNGSPYIVFRVRDTGCGIAPDQVERIFEPFTQAETGHKNTYTRGAAGTGLGLTISRRLARLMGGELIVESALGVGSEFKLLLPAPERRHEPRGKRPVDSTEWAAQREETGAAGRTPATVNASHQPGHLSRIGEGILVASRPIIELWHDRLRERPEFPHGDYQGKVLVEDHFATLVTDMGLALRFLDVAGNDPSWVLRDGSAIMRTISEQHGAQRCRIGWPQSLIELELSLLTEVLSEQIHEIAGPDAATEAEEATAVMSQLVAQSTRYSVAAFRFASSMAVRPETDFMHASSEPDSASH